MYVLSRSLRMLKQASSGVDVYWCHERSHGSTAPSLLDMLDYEAKPLPFLLTLDPRKRDG